MFGFNTKTSLLSLLLLAGPSLASSVKALTPSDFDIEVFSGTPSLVEFFAPWCGHCKKLAPTYEELADSLVGRPVNIASVDGDAHKALSKKYGVSGFPTIKWFDGKSQEPEDYNGGRDLESLQAFVSSKTGVKSKKKASLPSSVELLTDKTFSNSIGKDQDVLVAFTAPWCGHCKSLAPTWEQLATDFSSEPSVIIAKVDAEAYPEVAKEYGVTGYPTIKFFPKGSTTPSAYESGRDEKSFVSYINEKAGTHRVVGGGLDATAGTIEALDTILAKLTGNNLATIAEEAKTAASSLKDKYAEYYLKVLDKVTQNEGYITKELGRLEGILKKGGLVRGKEDDLTSRINVLKKFIFGKDEL